MTDTGPDNLPRGECLRLMTTVGVGRVIYTRQALPAADLVNFTLDAGDIVITGVRDNLAAAARDSVVAFEADHLHPRDKTGWQVTVIGHAREMTSPRSEHVLRITPEIVTGRTLHLSPGEINRWPSRAAS